MKILILGGTGRISRAVVSSLIRRGNDIWLLNRGNNPIISGTHFIKCDIYNFVQLYSELKDCWFDIVIDFLGYQIHDVQMRTELCSICKVKKYIFISSATVYDTSVNCIVNETSKVGNPYSRYALDKIRCEGYLLEKWEKEGFPCIIIRPSQTYNEYSVPFGVRGKKGSWQNIKRIIEGKQVIIHGNGNTMWTVTRSFDFAEWLSDIVEISGLEGEIIQITSDESMTWNEIYEIIADELGERLYPTYISSNYLAKVGKRFNLEEMILGDKGRNIIFDNSKLKALSAYRPNISMEKGIREAVSCIIKHKKYQIEDVEYEMWCNKICATYNE